MSVLKTKEKLRLVEYKNFKKNNKTYNIVDFANVNTYDKFSFFINDENLLNFDVGKDYYLYVEMYNYNGRLQFQLKGIE